MNKKFTQTNDAMTTANKKEYHKPKNSSIEFIIAFAENYQTISDNNNEIHCDFILN